MTDEFDTRLRPAALAAPSLLADARAVWASATTERRSQRVTLVGVALASACLTSACWLAWLRAEPVPDAPAPNVAQASMLPVPALPPSPIRLDDGSLVELRDATATLAREEISSERVRVRLTGGARFDIASDPARSFAVSNAQVLVRSFGATVSLDPEGMRTRVAVERGRVQVMWSSGAALLGAGEAATFPPLDEPALARRTFSESAQSKPDKHAVKRRGGRKAKASAR